MKHESAVSGGSPMWRLYSTCLFVGGAVTARASGPGMSWWQDHLAMGLQNPPQMPLVRENADLMVENTSQIFSMFATLIQNTVNGKGPL